MHNSVMAEPGAVMPGAHIQQPGRRNTGAAQRAAAELIADLARQPADRCSRARCTAQTVLVARRELERVGVLPQNACGKASAAIRLAALADRHRAGRDRRGGVPRIRNGELGRAVQPGQLVGPHAASARPLGNIRRPGGPLTWLALAGQVRTQ
jgi:hypothetical protein